MFDSTDVAERCRKAAGADVGLAGDDELCDAVRELAAARSALDAAEGHVLAELEARGVCERNFGLSTVSWVADQTKAPRGVCAARVRVAGQLRTLLGEVDEALGDGTIRFEHARAIVEAANPRIATDIADRQGELVDKARRAPFAFWRTQLGALAELLDQDGGYDPDRDLARNTMRITPLGPDHIALKGELVGEAALTVREAVEREADKVWRRAQRDQKETGDVAVPRRATCLALALAELCRRAHAVDPDTSHGPAVDLTLIVDLDDPDTLRTGDNEPLLARRYRHLTCDPRMYALIVDQLGVPLDLGREHRYANRAQRRALTARDGGCTFPGCDAPATWCDAHHIIEWDHGGTTDLPNLALLCRYHHGITHRHGWTMHTTHDQHFTWTTPTGRTIHSQRHQGRQL
jgi:Domain of unknown function (DUF222)/HNH endonuclease